MSLVRVTVCSLALLTACDPKEAPKPAAATAASSAASPTPTPTPTPSPSPSPAPSTSTTPAQLCDHYVALADPDKKLDAKARADKHTRCAKRAEGMKAYEPATYVCVVDCTLAAKDYATARKCRTNCRFGKGGGGAEGGKGVLGGPPGGAGAIKGAPSGSASAAEDDDD